MTLRLGIHIAADRLHVVVRRGDAVANSWTMERHESAQLGNQLRQSFERGAGRWWERRKVTIALGAALVRRKVLRGLPPIRDPRMLERMVQQSATRFFVGSPERFVVTAAPRATDVIAEAFDREVVEICDAAARAAGLAVSIVSATSAESLPRSTGTMEAAFDVAFAAARLPKSSLPAIHVAPKGARTPRWRRVAASVAAALSVVAFAVSPLVAARLAASRASDELRHLAPIYREVAAAERDVARFGRMAAKIEELSSGEAMTTMLARLTDALPFQAALVAATADTAGATLVVVADQVTPVLASFDTTRGISSARIVGPVSRERLGTLDLERATLRLDWKRSR